MAQYFTNFSDYTVGSTPSDWSLYLAPNSSLEIVDLGSGENALKINKNDNRILAVWDKVSDSQDLEIYMEWVRPSTQEAARSVVRLNLSKLPERNMYAGGLGGSNNSVIVKYASGNVSSLGAGSSPPSHARLRSRFRANQNNLLFRLWSWANPEPTAYDISSTDSTLTNGSAGIYEYQDVDLVITKFGVGTNGDPAPTSSVSTGVTDTAAITVATSALLASTESATAADTATAAAAQSAALTAVDTTASVDTPTIGVAAATPLTASESTETTVAVTDTAAITTTQATSSSAAESAVALGSAQVSTASATSLEALVGNQALDTAQITSATTSSLQGVSFAKALEADLLASIKYSQVGSSESATSLISGNITSASVQSLLAQLDVLNPALQLYGDISVEPILSAQWEIQPVLDGQITLH